MSSERAASGRRVDDRVQVTLRLPPSLHFRLVAKAAADKRSLNAWIVRAIETSLDAPKKTP